MQASTSATSIIHSPVNNGSRKMYENVPFQSPINGYKWTIIIFKKKLIYSDVFPIYSPLIDDFE